MDPRYALIELKVKRKEELATIKVPRFKRFEDALRDWGEPECLRLLNWAIKEKGEVAARNKLQRGQSGKEVEEAMKEWLPFGNLPEDRKLKALKERLDSLSPEARAKLETL
jgi:hypothetical protein